MTDPARDKVSIVLAVYNEIKAIRAAIESLMQQETPDFDLEILAIDGNSSDGTADIIKELEIISDGKVKYIFNEARITPVAFNLGIKAATGNFIAIFGSHAAYASNYLRICLDEIKQRQAAGCSGQVIPKVKEDDEEAELCLAILTSKIGVSGNSFRTRPAGFAESIPYGVYKKEVFDSVGTYDEKLVRNQDNDMNARILQAGFKLYITDQTHAHYYPKSSLKDLRAYAQKSGKWNAWSLKLGSYTLRVFHFVPFFFLLYNGLLAYLILTGFFFSNPFYAFPMLGLIALYWILAIVESTRQDFNFPLNYFKFPIQVFLFHLSYGFGTLKGFLSKPD